MEDDKDIAEAYRKKEAEFYCLKINVLKWNKIQCQKNVETVQAQLAGIKEKKNYEEAKLAKKAEELKEMEACTCKSNLIMFHSNAVCIHLSAGLRPTCCIHSTCHVADSLPALDMVFILLQVDEKAEEGEVKKLQQNKDETEKAIRKLVESRATDEKKQEHAQVRARFSRNSNSCAGACSFIA